MKKTWVKPATVLILLLILKLILPNKTIDPWNILNLNKVTTMVFALAFIQVFGYQLTKFLGVKAGTVLTGFLGGLISSTATTAALAKKNKISNSTNDVSIETITFLSATLAMLFEGLVMVVLSIHHFNSPLIIIFIGPLVLSILLIVIQSKKIKNVSIERQSSEFEIKPILRLSIFIVFILSLSKLLQHFFGESGLSILTFVISLFEIHGSVIANLQLYESNTFDTRFMSELLCLSILASYTSKLFLIYSLAHINLKKQVAKITFLLFLSLFLSWFLSRM